MNFFEAMNAILEGKKIRLETWPRGQFIGLEIEEKIRFGKNVKTYKLISEDLITTQLMINAMINQEFVVID